MDDELNAATQIDLVGNDIECAIEKARAGDTDSARWLLDEFCGTVESNRGRSDGPQPGKPLKRSMGGVIHSHTLFNEQLLDYLRECFRVLLADKHSAAAVALHLAAKDKRGPKKRESTRQNSLLVGLKAWEQYKEQSGLSDMPPADNRLLNAELESAFEEVGKAEHRSPSTVLRDYRAWRDCVAKAYDELSAKHNAAVDK